MHSRARYKSESTCGQGFSFQISHFLRKDFHKKSGINVNYADNTFSVPCPEDKPVIRWPLGNGNGIYYKQFSVEDNYNPIPVIAAHYSKPCEPIDADE